MTGERYQEIQKKSKKKKKRKKKRLRLYALAVILLGIAIICLSVLLLFRVRTIEVAGNEYSSDKDIVQMVQDDQYSVNSLYIFGKYMIGRGQVLPCFESVKISLKAPWTVEVTVEEKQIIGYVLNNKEYIYFDKEGLVVKKGNEKIEDAVCVEGIQADSINLYEPLKEGKSAFFEEILETTKELKKYDMNIKKIVCKDDRIYVYIKKVCVSLGSTVSAEKIAQIPPIMEKLGNKKGTLHLENYSEDRSTITFNKGEFPKEN
ncbi:MAG: cell division protein FtsQ/DivIB [Lachnospiraceae bacterium]